MKNITKKQIKKENPEINEIKIGPIRQVTVPYFKYSSIVSVLDAETGEKLLYGYSQKWVKLA